MLIRTNKVVRSLGSSIAHCAVLAMVAGCASKSTPYDSATPEGLGLLNRPSRPAEGLHQEATALEEAGKTSKAMSRHRYVYEKWPSDPLAPASMRARARLLTERGDTKKAFETWELLFTRHSGEFAYEEALEAMFALAQGVEEKRHVAFLGYKGYRMPEKAIPLYERLIKLAPRWTKSPFMMYRIGWLYQEQGDYTEAISAYTRVVARYPTSEEGELAAYGVVRCYAALAAEAPNNTTLARSAWGQATLYLSNHPNAARASEVMDIQKMLRNRIVKMAYEKARFYDRIAQNPSAAYQAYQNLLEEFPVSEWTDTVQQRIKELQPTTTSQP